jgi:ubiquinone/menaquinone biosynthesis C-methylase UbiE
MFGGDVMNTIKEVIQQRYGEAALQARGGVKAGCGCGTSTCCGTDPITSDLYDETQAAAVPMGAMLASLGCGNPTALAELKAGDVVLDLGSGGGIDVLLSARRVGPTGRVYGLDMTDQMLALARENQEASGLTNIEFLKAEIEHIPLPDNSVDVIISNCVINLSVDKDRVFAEAFRVLRPGGRFAVSDVIARESVVADAVRRSRELWVGCVAGALGEETYRDMLTRAGFEEVGIEPTRIYRAEDMQQFLSEAGLSDEHSLSELEGRFMSAFVRAQKPAAPVKTCCTSTCCT